MLSSLDQTIGLARVPVLHTNDCRTPLGSHRDRHEHIGKGGIGLEGFRRIVNHPALREKVFILETPIEEEGDDVRNMQAIRSLRNEFAAPIPVRAAASEIESEDTAIPTTRSGTFESTEAIRNARL